MKHLIVNLPTLLCASSLLLIAGCAQGTGSGVDPNPVDESASFGNPPPAPGASGGSVAADPNFDAATECATSCALQAECGALDEDTTQADCEAECNENFAAMEAGDNPACQGDSQAFIKCMNGLSCEDLAQVMGSEEIDASGACANEQANFVASCFGDLIDDLVDGLDGSSDEEWEDDDHDDHDDHDGEDAATEEAPTEEVPAEDVPAEEG